MPNKSSFNTEEEWREWYRVYRKKHAKKFRDYNREYNKIWRRDLGYQNEENSKLRYPEKVQARKILQLAVRVGNIKRGKCEICNKKDAQAHHEDYSKPLEVIWLCPLHHKDKHRKY